LKISVAEKVNTTNNGKNQGKSTHRMWTKQQKERWHATKQLKSK